MLQEIQGPSYAVGNGKGKALNDLLVCKLCGQGAEEADTDMFGLISITLGYLVILLPTWMVN